MTTARAKLPAFLEFTSPIIRVLNRDRTLYELLADAEKENRFQVKYLQNNHAQHDYAQIDPTLAIASQLDPSHPCPRSGLSYAGFTPQQRLTFLRWLETPTDSADPTYQLLHLAHIETCLFEKEQLADEARTFLRTLHKSKHWAKSEALSRTTLLAFWLQQESAQLVQWLEKGHAHVNTLGVALGHAALVGQILTPTLLNKIMQEWKIIRAPLDAEMARVRLSSLTSTLGMEPLAYALQALGQALGDEAQTPKPWRSAHRELRIALPQPDLRPILNPILNEVKTIAAQTASPSPESSEQIDDDETAQPDKWTLVLEFQQSRSEYFDFALTRARQRPGYSQIMDENRQIVYRVTFKKREMRHFWSLWEYVQKWNGTEVYVNGKAIDQWQIWPYSRYLR